jgi:hypothetical protein
LSLIWIFRDERVWAWDQSLYARATLQLYYTLINSPINWFTQMMLTLGAQAPGIAWLGQFFVPLGDILGSTEKGLLLYISLIQFLVLILVFKSNKFLSNGKNLIALMASLSVASAPLFVGLSHQYLVEPLQTLAVSWFIFIMSFSPKWGKKNVLISLMFAIPFAMLAKISSPIYCFAPAVVALIYDYLPPFLPKTKNNEQTNIKDNLTYLWIFFGLFLGIISFVWYIKNWSSLIKHIKLAASSELWGHKDTFLNKFNFWLTAFQKSFFLEGIYILVLLVFIVGLVVSMWSKNRKFSHFDLCSFSSFINIITVLSVFSFSANEDVRFLLPLLPHVSVLIAWSLFQLNGKIITIFVVVIFSIQLISVHLQSLGIIHFLNLPYVTTLEADPQKVINIEKLVQKTCSSNRITNSFIGLDQDWLNGNTFNYFATKKLKKIELPCTYIYPDQAETDISKAWQKLLSSNINYFISVKPSLIPNNPFNQVSLALLQKVKNSSDFKLDSIIGHGDSEILVYKHEQNFDIGQFKFINNKDEKNYGYIDTVNNSTDLNNNLVKGQDIQIGGWAIIPSKNKAADKVIITMGNNNSIIGISLVNIDRPDIAQGFKNPKLMKSGWNAVIDSDKLSTQTNIIKAWSYDSETKEAFPLKNVHTMIFK